MSELDTKQWRELNDRAISAGVAWVRALLGERADVPAPTRRRGFFSWFTQSSPEKSTKLRTDISSADAWSKWLEANEHLKRAGAESTLAQLARRFNLTAFEQSILLLCLAFELDTRVGWLCGLIQDRPHRPFPTFGLAMSLFAQPDWGTLPPEQPLRKFHLIEVRQPSGAPLVGAELRIDETIVHYLRGIPSLDARLSSLVAPLDNSVDAPADSQQALVERLTAVLARLDGSSLTLQLAGRPVETLRVAQAAARQSGWRLCRVAFDALVAATNQNGELAQLWQRDSALFRLALLVDAQDSIGASDPVGKAQLAKFAAGVSTPILLSVHERMPLSGVRDFFAEVSAPTAGEQREAWQSILPESWPTCDALAGELSRQFCLSSTEMRDAVASVLASEESDDLRTGLWRACRDSSRPRLDGLAQRIDVKATWDDLVLSDERRRILEQIRNQVRSRWRVYDEWGVADSMNRGLGIASLFAGDSGTGKTMAAEVIANDLQLDLFCVDLSMVVNKYIGETEKHLRRLFDAVESCGAILCFDECDALFGKRSEVKDSHDRYANIEISYLLQRLESYRGLCILTTNNRGALDQSFLRRFRFVLTFPMPTVAERKQIWQRHFGTKQDGLRAGIPTTTLDYDRLAQLPFSGGNIHSVVVNAAFRAAGRDAGASVTMRDVLAAARDELSKLERPIDESDFMVVDEAAPEAAA